ncbi:hypothetical protein B5V03_11445 [Bradyrhizobium betae]|uniref:Uncharacterized protein n=2 Tax=Bradyrhizobium betae TaxID=244734 RepID=A0A4Q1VCR1_9BRAD|nr:hypothetical protein B5V03_11445 [Bradyrhizobium betae]
MGLHVWTHSDMYTLAMTVTVRKPLDFRDIRTDIRARIRSLEDTSQRQQAEFVKAQEKAAAEHRQIMEGFKSAIDSYKRMLDLEEAMASHNMLDTRDKGGPAQTEVKIPVPVALPPLADFFVSKLAQNGPLTKEELREAAQAVGYFGEAGGGGRATHATLENIKRSKRVVLGDDGKFHASEMEKALL